MSRSGASAVDEFDAFWMLLTATAGLEDEQECARLVATGLPRVLDCDVCGLALAEDGEKDRWNVVLHPSRDPEPPEVKQLDELYARTRAQGDLVLRANDRDWDNLPDPLRRNGAEVLSVIPLRTLRHELGLLMAGRRRSAPFTDRERFVLRRFGEQVSVTVENLRLRRLLEETSEGLEDVVARRTDELRESEKRLRVLLEINNAVVSNLERGALFRTIAASLRKVVSLDRASLCLKDPEGDVFRVAALAEAAMPEESIPEGTEISSRKSHLARVVRDREPQIRTDLYEGDLSPMEENLRDAGLRSYLSVPLVSRDAVLGTLNVGSRRPNQFGDRDAELLTQVAKQVALAVENMLAFEEMEGRKERAELQRDYLLEEVEEAQAFGEIVGVSAGIRRVEEQIEQVAPTQATVLIAGESGTGKELVAREIHRRSGRRDGPMIKVNCASVPRDLYESEFFGHVEGAFTGAVNDRAGRFAAAEGGTLFLDEVGEIPLELQSKLLRVLEEGEYQRVGEERTRKADVRVIAATNRPLEQDVESGRFRRDLYYRLNVFPIEVPPLRERKKDIRLLAEHFLAQISELVNQPAPDLTGEVLERLTSYSWPGNVRELRNVLERAVIASGGDELELQLPGGSAGDRVTSSGLLQDILARAAGEDAEELAVLTEEEMERVQKSNIRAALEKTDGKVYGRDGAAELLGIPPTTLASRMERMGIHKPR